MVYSNNIFRLLKYNFSDINSYNFLQLVQECKYSLEDINISLEEVIEVSRSVSVEPEVTFVQANSFDKIISLTENLNENSMTTREITELFGFKERQSDYYYNAYKYLGLADKSKNEDGLKVVSITTLGKRFLKLPYKQRQLEYVKLILKHQIFNDVFMRAIYSGEIPDKSYICNRMRELNVCTERLIDRCSSSVKGWIYWIFSIIN